MNSSVRKVPVSYTHLDVYKRQITNYAQLIPCRTAQNLVARVHKGLRVATLGYSIRPLFVFHFHHMIKPLQPLFAIWTTMVSPAKKKLKYKNTDTHIYKIISAS